MMYPDAPNMLDYLHIRIFYLILLIVARCEQVSSTSNSVATSDISSLEKDGEDCSTFLQNKASVLDSLSIVEESATREHECLRLLHRTARQCRAEHIPFSITDHAAPFENLSYPERDDKARSLINHSFPGLVVLNEEHQIYAVEGFLSQDERKSLVTSTSRDAEHKSLGLLQQQTSESQSCEHLIHTVDNTNASDCSFFHYRNSYQSCAQNKTMLDNINKKVDSLLPGLKSHLREPLVITRYPTGGFYSEHVDGRRATVLLHLSEEGAFTGGATFFRRVGLRVHGKPGLALVFFPNFGKVCNDLPHGESSPCEEFENSNLAHMAEEVESGEKLIGQIWIGRSDMDTCKSD